MRTLLAAAIALSATTGLALAQNGEGEAPQLIGDLSGSVDDRYNGDNRINTGNGVFSIITRSSRDTKERVGLEIDTPDRYTGR